VNADLSVAPEIAQLAAPFVPARQGSAAPSTDGRVAADLRDLAATPQRWWDLVRFDPDGPVRIPVPGVPGSWLLVLPPGTAADCDCQQAIALAGEAAEVTVLPAAVGAPRGAAAPGSNGADQAAGSTAGRPLRPGRVLVHGGRVPHQLHATGPGYSVTLHATVSRLRSLSGAGPHLRTGALVPRAGSAENGPAPAGLSEFSACLRQAQPGWVTPTGYSAKSSPRVTRWRSWAGQN
jgi:hypothetical protein